ncbi:hypothetical protein HO173_003317 [Letharia columbiana]|uniref:C2H2-type domain-containing protein n=1 Tax=Letharia columbiana TaxID=112416 RepID=A0A8H6G1W3_9LECA|nr:uncharacterized protein HO173_003317 [Letharia columbiana]KAF6238810.1 hypothetical protein HO173_003317 [Letharia columbiana]
MSRRIDPRRPKELTEAQSASIRQEEEIQELRGRRDELFQRIRHQFTFIYRAEGHAIYDQYEEAKRAVDRKIKARERELMKQIQKEYDAIAPVQDMRAQLEGDVELLSLILPASGPDEFAFVERSRIAKAFFDPPSTRGPEGDVDCRVSIVDDMVSLCIRQEGVFRKARRIRRIQGRKSHPRDADTECTSNAVKSESTSESDFPGPHLFPARCKPYQCLYCLGDANLPLEERLHNLGSKYSLQRHFDRRHPFPPGEPCPFPHSVCSAVTLNSVMHFKNHAAKVHGIYMSDKV